MLEKFRQASVKADLKLRNAISNFSKEEKGGAEIVAIMLIIIVLIAVILVFRTQLEDLIKNLFQKIGKDVDSKL
jgi:Flp pilus assembly pilin Flp